MNVSLNKIDVYSYTCTCALSLTTRNQIMRPNDAFAQPLFRFLNLSSCRGANMSLMRVYVCMRL